MLLRFLLIINAVVTLNGCINEPPPLLRIGTNIWPGYEPFYVARENGWFDEQQIRLVEFGSAVDVMDALRQQRIEGGGLTLDEALMLASEGIDLTVVMICDQSEGADVLMVTPAIQQLAEMRGKRIAVETSAVGALMLEASLQAADLSRQDIEVISLEPREQKHAWEQGTIDAAVTFEPYKSHLQRSGARVLFSSKDIPGQILDVLVIRSHVLDQHKHSLRKLISAFFRARQQLVQQDRTTLEQINRRLQLTPDELREAFAGLRLPSVSDNHEWLDNGRQLNQLANSLADLMYRQGLSASQHAAIRSSAELLPEQTP